MKQATDKYISEFDAHTWHTLTYTHAQRQAQSTAHVTCARL